MHDWFIFKRCNYRKVYFLLLLLLPICVKCSMNILNFFLVKFKNVLITSLSLPKLWRRYRFRLKSKRFTFIKVWNFFLRVKPLRGINLLNDIYSCYFYKDALQSKRKYIMIYSVIEFLIVASDARGSIFYCCHSQGKKIIQMLY